ncbi:HAMP domain-containing histidine kinase [bacterium]|nr:HAMP domain-containing histidine kinase [bacterium]MBU1919398.1 HAMP domain-containing histidine kinase [bacterium]
MRFNKRFIYQHVGTFKGVLFLAAIIVIISVLGYTQYLVGELRESTRSSLTQKIKTYSVLISSDNPDLIGVALDQIQAVEFPIIVTDAEGRPKLWKNIGFAPDDTSEAALQAIRELVEVMDEEGNPPLPIHVGAQVDSFHYSDSIVIQQLRWLPWIEIVVAALFIIIGYSGFQTIRRSEESMVWAGLAKETAHQLGTPITSLMGWLEFLRSEGIESRALTEMERDFDRLERVSARFSQIGSESKLAPHRIRPLVMDTVDYFQRRLPSKGTPIEIRTEFPCDPVVNINPQLFGWVLENLVKNSIDAMFSSGGRIIIRCSESSEWIHIDVIDNGPGISKRNRRNVFRPGFTTRTRGWGLGLSLSRRIVEEYHGGRLFVKETAVGVGTVMRVSLRNKQVA